MPSYEIDVKLLDGETVYFANIVAYKIVDVCLICRWEDNSQTYIPWHAIKSFEVRPGHA